MRRPSLPSFAAGALLATTITGIPAAIAVTNDPIPNTYDGTSPSLTLQPLEFATGASIDAAPPPVTDGSCDAGSNFAVPLRMRWATTDGGSGISDVTVWGSGTRFDGFGKEAVYPGSSTTSYQFDDATDYEGDCGMGAITDYDLWVKVQDNRGNSASSIAISPTVDIWDENGNNRVDVVQWPTARTGTWSISTCSCFNNGRVIYSTTAGASMTYTVTTRAPGQAMAVVMPKNTNRGKVNISVDGGTPAVVDTYAASAVHRVIVWQKFVSGGTHTLKLTNAGTAGRPRIDIDAIMLANQGGRPPEKPIT